MKGWEWSIILILVILLIFVLSFSYFLQKNVFNAMNNPQKIQALILQLTSLETSVNANLQNHFTSTFMEYLKVLVDEGKMTATQATNLLSNGIASFTTFALLYGEKIIDWRYFIENYYYKNNPSLEIVPVSQIPI